MTEVIGTEEVDVKTTTDIQELSTGLAVLEEREKNNTVLTERALSLQAIEYERRLTILNGEATRLRDIQATYLPREVAENKFIEITKEINELKTAKDQAQGRGTVITTIVSAAISIGIGLLFLFLQIYLKK